MSKKRILITLLCLILFGSFIIAELLTKHNIYIISAFNGPHGENMDLYTTQDMKTFLPINTEILFKPLGDSVRDPSIIFHDHYFYVCFTGFHGFQKDFIVARSKNLINWEQRVIKTPNQFKLAWAPQWFVDKDDKVSIIVSLSTGEKQKDVWNNSIPFFRSYIMKAKDNNIFSFNSPQLVKYSKSDNHIDPYIFRDKSDYLIFVKNEFNKTIEMYKSKGLTDRYTYIQTMPFDQAVEGPSIQKQGGIYYLYADEFVKGKSVIITSTNLKKWSGSKRIDSIGLRTQHFDIFKLNYESLRIVQNIIINK